MEAASAMTKRSRPAVNQQRENERMGNTSHGTVTAGAHAENPRLLLACGKERQGRP